jgi:hypothetical protein
MDTHVHSMVSRRIFDIGESEVTPRLVPDDELPENVRIAILASVEAEAAAQANRRQEVLQHKAGIRRANSKKFSRRAEDSQ